MTTLLPRAAEEEEERLPAASLEPRGISYDRHGFRIDGRRRILLAGTIAYFRLARSDWRDRLTRLKQAGFNTVDVYVPWNFHELAEGAFDFSTGNRDLGAYLALCRDLGLFVYFRPGPYICNEWDGGGLPAWLYTKPDVRLRQNEPNYLGYVRRYLDRVNEIVRPFLHSRGGGPVILYALENELDFFPCADPAGYIGALRDMVRADGIDGVPLTACIGDRTPVRKATGLADGVIPSPNIYYSGDVEKEAARTLAVLHGEYFQSGAPMRDVPPFVTEMHRDENSLRRILAAGFKGLGPFNFAGGANFGRWHAVNNWKGLSYLATSIDFGGMISFDGRIGKVFADARRLAGLINAFEEEIVLGEPVTSWEAGAPVCDNPLLGAQEAKEEDATRPGRLYSLIRGDGGKDGAFVFLYNGTTTPQTAHVTAGGLAFPRQSTLEVAPHYDHIALANLPLSRFGIPATLRYSTAEVTDLIPAHGGEAASLRLCGPAGTTGEVRLEAKGLRIVGPAPEGCYFEGSDDALTLVFRFSGDRFETVVEVSGGARLRLIAQERAAAGWEGLPEKPAAAAPAQNLLTAARERAESSIPPPAGTPDPSPREGADLLPLERLGILQGAGWYEVSFETPAAAAAAGTEIVLAHAGDIVTASLDGRYLGTYLGDGGPLTIPLPADAAETPGRRRHALRLRAEIWGHSNFHDARWPSAHLGSLRGVWGAPTIGGEALPRGSSWRFTPEPDATAAAAAATAWTDTDGGPAAVPGGETRLLRFALPWQTAPLGATLTLGGTDCHGEVWLGGELVGRFFFGPNPPAAITGGPGDRFFLPAEYLRGGEAPLILVVRGAGAPGGDGGRLDRADLEIIASGRAAQ